MGIIKESMNVLQTLINVVMIYIFIVFFQETSFNIVSTKELRSYL